MIRRPRAALVAILLLASAAASGATRYVTDELRISVRTGAGDQYRIIEVIDTGTRVDTLETSGEWTRLRTPEGNVGWSRSQYLVESPVAADRLREVRAELEEARARIGELESALAASRRETESARQRIEELTSETERLQARLTEAQEGLEMHERNERLGQYAKELNRRIATLEEERQRLADRSRREWFVIGAAVLLGGMLFGIIVTRIPWRGRRDRMF